MGKGKKQPAIKQTPGFITDNPEKFVRECAKIIQNILGTSHFGFRCEYLSDKGQLYSLNTGTCRAHDTKRGSDYWVIPFDPSCSDGAPYWLTLSITFSSVMLKFKLAAIRIIVFKGAMIDDDKEPFFRAEWAASDIGTSHAQPHWHVYRTLQDVEIEASGIEYFKPPSETEEIRDFGDTDTAFKETEPNNFEVTPFDKFHFAMAANWHIDDRNHIDFQDEQTLINWLSRCINYMRLQLYHLSSKEHHG